MSRNSESLLKHSITTLSFEMSVIHPFQVVLSNEAGDLVFVVAKSTILAYHYKNDEYNLIGKWVDELARNSNDSDADVAKIHNSGFVKKLKSNEGKTVKQSTADPLFPIITSQIRNLQLSEDETKLVACADSDKSVIVLDIVLEADKNCLKLIKRQPFPKRPNAIAMTDDDKLIIADKFGDVFEMEAFTEGLQEIKEPILGHVSMLTDVLFAKDSQGKKYIITSDRDEHIKISCYPQCFIVDKWLFGHREFISSLNMPKWEPEWLFSAGGDECLFAWNWVNGEKLSQFDYADLIKPHLNDSHLAAARFQNENNDVIEYAVSKVASTETIPFVAFFVDSTNILIILKVCETTGSLSLGQTIEFPFKIVSLSASGDEFQVTCDNRHSQENSFVQFITFNKTRDNFEINVEKSTIFNEAVIRSLKEEESVKVEIGDIYPLYNITSLKKHGEHYS